MRWIGWRNVRGLSLKEAWTSHSQNQKDVELRKRDGKEGAARMRTAKWTHSAHGYVRGDKGKRRAFSFHSNTLRSIHGTKLCVTNSRKNLAVACMSYSESLRALNASFVTALIGVGGRFFDKSGELNSASPWLGGSRGRSAGAGIGAGGGVGSTSRRR